MRIVVTGGGTAGHISPILAAVDALKRLDSKAEFLYVGQHDSMEARMAREANLRFAGIFAGKYRRVPGSSLRQKLSDVESLMLNTRDMVRTTAGIGQSLAILRRFRPDVVFCKGGFVALPVGIAAAMLKIPVIIHESDIVPGLGTKILARYAQRVAVGFPPELYPTLPQSKLVFTGNPVRSKITGGNRVEAATALNLSSRRKTILVMGGSQGAVPINDAILSLLPQLIKKTQIIHVTGMYDLERVVHGANGIGQQEGYCVRPFLDVEQMAAAYALADVVVGRAGANTIAELAELHKATILIPNRLSAAHQLANARRLADAGAVRLVDGEPLPANQLAKGEDQVSAEVLMQQISELLSSAKIRKELGDKLATFNVPDAPRKLAEVILALGRRVV